ncbi:geranylgeranyl reductase family protein [Chloroflexota bacterium]
MFGDSDLLDVIVAGAGPVGSHVACKLAEQGYSVAVFEEHNTIGEPVQCTGIIGRECIERYHIPQEVVLFESKSAKFFSPSGKYLRLAKDEVQAYIVDRTAMDLHLAHKAQNDGAQYYLSSKVGDVRTNGTKVVLDIKAEGVSTSLESRALVVTSGFGTKLPYKLRMGRVGDWVAGAQMEVEINGVDEVEVYLSQNIAPGFFGWLVPTGKNRGLVGLFSRKAPRRHLDRFIESLRSQGKITAKGRITSGGIPLRPLPKTYAERVLVVGDAAGQVKPTTGGGVYYGFICADIAVDVLSKAFDSDDFSAKAFSLYQKIWKKAIGKELKIGYWARRVYERLSDRQIELMLRILESRGIHEAMLNSDQMRFDWHGGLLLKWLKYIGPWRHLFGWNKDKS